MSLVAYDNSDSSEYEDDNDNKISTPDPDHTVSQPVQTKSPLADLNSPDTINQGAEIKIFNLLPQPSTKKITIAEEDDEFLHKKEDTTNIPKPKAKISVPSLSDFKDVESIAINKPRTANGKKSGLLSMLPQPRHATLSSTRNLIPHVLTKGNNTAKKIIPHPTVKRKPDSKVNAENSDESDDDLQNDFFSFNKPVEEPIIDLPINDETTPIAETVAKQPRTLESYFKKEIVETHIVEEVPEPSYEQSYEASSSSQDAVLDEEAILKLCGTRGKRKREEIQIVDVNQQEVLDDARKWLMKGLMDDTTKRVSSSKRRGNDITSQQKRKHQITYLAHQAKANEAELQNQWANNRMSKRQTQSKYGF